MINKKEKNNLTKIKLKNSTRVSLVMFSLIVFAISSANFYNSIYQNSFTTIEEQEIYTYQNDYNSDYSINIKTNPFIEEVSLPSGQTYVSDLIDSIDMNMNYKYTASDTTPITYSYKIDAILKASYNDNGKDYNVWNKTYNLKTSEELFSDSEIIIDESVNIDYKKYHEEVSSFKQTLGMSLDSKLYINLTVDTSTIVNNQTVENQYVSDFSITLGDKIAIVDSKNKDTKTDTVKYENSYTHSKIDIRKLIISLITMIICLYIIYYIWFKTRKLNSIRNEYKLELNRILKSCQDRIVIVKNQIESDEETLIDVNDFGELIKLSEELYKPILCWISDDINDQKAHFSIISNKVKYRFILTK